MRLKRYTITLTDKQADLIWFGLHAAVDQHEKHLMHDGYRDGCGDSWKETDKIQRDLKRAFTMYAMKLSSAQERERERPRKELMGFSRADIAGLSSKLSAAIDRQNRRKGVGNKRR